MAETVKKSRIVSEDENLEDSLMEEFNLRLKNCMSQDKLEAGDEEQPAAEDEPTIYENVETIRTNGNCHLSKAPESTETFLENERGQNHHHHHYETVETSRSNDKTEKELCERDEEGIYENIRGRPSDINIVQINEPAPETAEPVLEIERTDDAATTSIKAKMFLSTDDTSCLLFTQTVTSPMLTPSEENIDFLKAFKCQTNPEELAENQEELAGNQEELTENQQKINGATCRNEEENIYENVDELEEPQYDVPRTMTTNKFDETYVTTIRTTDYVLTKTSVETGDISLRTSEAFIANEARHSSETCHVENVDQVKGTWETNDSCQSVDGYQDNDSCQTNGVWQPEETCQTNQTCATNETCLPASDTCLENETCLTKESCQSNETYEENETCQQENDPCQEKPCQENEPCQENQPFPENEPCQQSKPFPEIEPFHENEPCTNESRTHKANVIIPTSETSEENGFLSHESSEPGGALEQRNGADNKRESTSRKVYEAVNENVRAPSNVEILKSQFLSESPAIKTKSQSHTGDYRSFDITSQINKFENKSPQREDSTTTNHCADLIETVETQTVFETTIETQNGTEKGMKKKKSKKSRSHEKENISVSDNINNMPDDCSYNVNVKNLCRSFGDLTKLEDERYHNRRNMDDTIRMRTKSMLDVRNNNSCKNSSSYYGPIKSIENVFGGVSVKRLREKFNINRSSINNNVRMLSKDNCAFLKSSFNKFDALQKKNVLHVRSNDSAKAQDKFNGAQQLEGATTNCKACDKQVFQMEQIKAERSIWHKNCFRCQECNKQLNVDTYESHEGALYCKPHFRSLFAPKVVEDEEPPKPKKHELIIRENQPQELPPDVVRASDKPDLGLEELQSLNVKERFQVFEHYQDQDQSRAANSTSPINVKKSQSILSKLAKFQAKGMDIGVADESLNGIPIEESSEEEEEPEEEVDGEDADLVRAKRVQKEKPFHFTQMSDVKSKWENVDQNSKDERREERKQEIQSIRNRLFMGKQGKMKEMYQQAVIESELKGKKSAQEDIEIKDTRSIKEKFEKGEIFSEDNAIREKDNEDMSVFESGISKKSRSIFLELDANAQKSPQVSPVSPSNANKDSVRKARDAYMNRQQSEDVVKSDMQEEDVEIRTADISQRFKFFETYREPEQHRKQFRITPPRDGQVKAETPDREIYRDPDIVRSEETVEDSMVAKKNQTATKMLSKFRQMEENLYKDQAPAGLKPLKRFTPPPEPTRPESSSEGECTGSEEESEDELDNSKVYRDEDLLEAQKAARAKQLRAKFERWEANEIKREQNNSSVNIAEEIGDEQSIETTKSLRARFESMREQKSESNRPRVKVNRFVSESEVESCEGCKHRVYPLEKITVHGQVFHKKCFKCMECHAILRMNSFSYNQGLLYCLPHFKRLFITKGNYDSAFGLEEHKDKWNTSLA